ncbi:M14 family metallopeptidase [Longimicrobium sp.]|uniref:M14 family metallopeptidase n=1 Tax=Longimicrobium sp. TaxID=2029185 RepID=UPI002C2654A2|nr:M14 family metallopeptidase [Longimicrobium sp.]HSU15645.1 M14 family metallopeptidase [Longimicrobium sp.]
MRRRLLLVPILLSAISTAAAAQGGPLTRAERTDFRETSRYADVLAFLDTVGRASPLIHLTTFGYSWEGRALPLAVAGTPGDASSAAVRASGKTVVYLQGDIHAGEVEGKEALLEILRDIAAGRHRAWTDSLVLLVAPIFNPDGNERIALNNRPQQHGPVAGMGTRPNAQGLNINRDFSKLETPEARSQALLMQAYDPQVLVDLHTTDGTLHAYQLTFAPPLHPNTDPAIVSILRDEWLPAVTASAKRKYGYDFHDYGNVPAPESPWAAGPGAERGWYTYDWRPRFSNHYWGLRNRFGILSETYSYLTFRERVEVQKRFVEEVLDWAAQNASRIRRVTVEADRRSVVGTTLAVTARLRRTGPNPILMGEVSEERNPYSGEVMWRRRDVVRPERMPEFTAYDAAETERAPAAWLVPDTLRDVAERLAAHGIRFERVASVTGAVEAFRIDSAATARSESEGHRERRIFGAWRVSDARPAGGWLRVPADQPLGRLAFTLLEPRSDDGFATWGLLDAWLKDAAVYPILRQPAPAASPPR